MSLTSKARLLVLGAFSALTACSASPSDKVADQTKKNSEQSVAMETKSTVTTVAEPVTTSTASVTTSTEEVDINKLSEALGHFLGRNLKAPGIEFNTESIIKGIREGVAGQPSPMSEQDYEKAMTALQQKAQTALTSSNLEAAEKFMKENVNTKGVVDVVPGKLQYLILEQGNDPVVPEHGVPLINYTGKYIDGTVFGSSESSGGPITVPIDQTIPGFSKGIAGMKEGEKRRLFVHPEMGYGTSGQLPPNSLLIFDIEVVKATSPDKDQVEAEDLEDDLDDDLDDDLEQDEDHTQHPVK